MKRIESGSLVYYRNEQWSALRHGVFTRHGGYSAPPWASLNVGGTVGDDLDSVRRNHQLMYDTLDVDGSRACTVWQVHGADTVIVDRPVQGRRWIAQADGIVTNRPGLPLVMRYADCTPIMFYDPHKKVIGLAHAGWRGTVQGAAASVAETMIQAYDCDPAAIQVCIGPGIGPERYQVGEEVVQAVRAHFGTTKRLIRRDSGDGTAYLDLWTANKLDLERIGLRQIDIAGICTAQRTDEFFSHRGENGRTGRFGLVMSL